MGEVDRNVLEAHRQLSRFCGQVALLLGTADGMMARGGWRGAASKTAVANTSGSLDYPGFWLPHYFFRLYTHAQFPNLVSFISVIIDEPEAEKWSREALASAGWLDYGDSPLADWEYWHTKSHLWSRDRDDNGKLCVGDLVIDGRKYTPPGLRRVVSFAYPLSAVTDTPTLERLIVQRLCREIQQAHAADR